MQGNREGTQLNRLNWMFKGRQETKQHLSLKRLKVYHSSKEDLFFPQVLGCQPEVAEETKAPTSVFAFLRRNAGERPLLQGFVAV